MIWKKKVSAKQPSASPHHIIHLFIFGVAGIVLAQCPHQNHGHQSHQEDNHHERVEDAEPVNLKHGWKEQYSRLQKIQPSSLIFFSF